MRIDGWESRLIDLIDSMRSQSFALGESDCCRFSCRLVQAMTGENHWPKFFGYTSKRDVALIIAKYGRKVDDVISFILGKPINIRFAQRGDICCFESVDLGRALGVCIGENAVFLAPFGIIFIPTLVCSAAWRVD